MKKIDIGQGEGKNRQVTYPAPLYNMFSLCLFNVLSLSFKEDIKPRLQNYKSSYWLGCRLVKSSTFRISVFHKTLMSENSQGEFIFFYNSGVFIQPHGTWIDWLIMDSKGVELTIPRYFFSKQLGSRMAKWLGRLLFDQKVQGSIPGSNILCTCHCGDSNSSIQAHDFFFGHPVFWVRR